MNEVDEVKQKTDIVSIIGERINIKKAGRNYKGLCPFHSEKSPSFMVSSELQLFRCFGCLEHGDVFNFLEKFEGMDFYESLKYLAERAGVTLSAKNTQKRSEKDDVIEANILASKFYHYILTKLPIGKPGLLYLKEKRLILDSTIETFQIGYAPESPSLLFDFLTKKKNIPVALLEKSGLVVRTQRGFMDRFRGRAIFPITDARGNVIALGGRILPQFDNGKMGKYINSPETPAYHKSDSLFGLSVTRGDIKKANFAVIVEGELDLITPWQSGVKNIVAIKGSSLTEAQIRVLSRYTKSIVLALDSDFAGDKAAVRGLSLIEAAGLDVRVARLNEYKDPDDFAKADPQGLKNAISGAFGIWDFLIDTILSHYDLSQGNDKSKASHEIVPLLASIQDRIVQSHYAQLVARKLAVPLEAVMDQILKISEKNEPGVYSQTKEVDKVTRREVMEKELFIRAFQVDPTFLLDPEHKKYIKDPIFQKIISHLDSSINKEDFSIKTFVESLPAELRDTVSSIVMQSEDSIDDKTILEFEKIVEEMETLELKEKLSELSAEIGELENTEREEELKKAQEKFSEYSKRLNTLLQKVRA
jgi:DNA primase